jgi:hypothetical protein
MSINARDLLAALDPERRALVEAQLGAAPSSNKFSVAPRAERTWNGVVYDSKAEMLYARDVLGFAHEHGQLKSWDRQVKIPLGEDDSLRVDFVVVQLDGSKEAHEVKGVWTSDFRRKVRLWRKYGPMPLLIIKKHGPSWDRSVVLPGNTKE